MDKENQKLHEELLKLCDLQEKGKNEKIERPKIYSQCITEEKNNTDIKNEEFEEYYTESSTPNAYQDWVVPTKFPCCPIKSEGYTLNDYLLNLKIGEIFCQNKFFTSEITKFGYNKEKQAIIVQTIQTNKNSVKPWHITEITLKEGIYYHSSYCSCFKEDGAEKYYTLACGKEWNGEDVFDDFC